LALVRAFLARFFENEVTAGAHDLKAALFWLIALLAMPGAIVPALIGLGNAIPVNPYQPDPSTWGWAMIAKYQGVEVLRSVSRADKTLYIGFAMMASAMLSAITWSSVLPDRRDALVLGILPVRPASIIGAKLAALAIYVILVSVAMHALASLSFGFFLAAENTMGFAVRGIAAHFVASCLASVFVCLVVVALQGVVLVLAGPRRFARASAVMQAALVGTVVLGLVTLPLVSSSVVDSLAGNGPQARSWILHTPPLWFLGIYEWVIGAPGPQLQQLAGTAMTALGCVLLTILVTYPLACRRLLVNAIENTSGFGRVGRWSALARLIARACGRHPDVRAVSQHYLATMARVGTHRFVMSIAVGAAIAWSLPSWMTLASGVPAAPRTDLLSLPITAMFFILVGLRTAVALPSEIQASWIFDVRSPDPDRVRQAVERTMFIVGVVPVVLISSAAFLYLWGPAFAALHAVSALAIGAFLTELVLLRLDIVPCAKPWIVPAGHFRKFWPLYLVLFATITRALPMAEGAVLRNPQWMTLVVPILLWFAWKLREAALRPPDIRDGESAEMLTQALRLGRGRGEMADGFPARRRPIAAPASTPSVFDWLRTPEGEERWHDDIGATPVALGRDVSHAFRRLRLTPVFTLFAIVSIGLGIGATTAAYSVFHSLLWSQPAVRDADRMVIPTPITYTSRGYYEVWSWPDFTDYRGVQRSFSGFAATTLMDGPLIGGPIAMPAQGEAVNGDYFNTLGMVPAAGRLLQPRDDRPDAPPAIVLSGTLWRRFLHSDPGVIGTTMTLRGRAFEVVGVAPAGYRGLDFANVNRPPLFWVPLSMAPVGQDERADSDDRSRHRLFVKGRLAPGRTIDDASNEMAAIGHQLEAAYPTPAGTGATPPNAPGRQWKATENEPVKGWTTVLASAFIVAVAIVLLVACTNLANLSLARGASRAHEVSVRKALGASRGRLVRELVMESAIVVIAGSGVAFLTLRALVVRLTGDVPIGTMNLIVFEPKINVTVLAMSAAIAMVVLAIVGVLPALELTRRPVREALAAGGYAASTRWRLHHRFIAWQVAATVALLLVAAACVRVLVRDVGAQAGIDMEHLAIVSLDLDAKHFSGVRAREAIDDIVAGAAHARPDIEAAAATSVLPFDVYLFPNNSWVTTGDKSPRVNSNPATTRTASVTVDFFKAMGLPMLRGRGFDVRDRADSQRVGVVNESFARQILFSREALGKEVTLWKKVGREPVEDYKLTIVGITADTDIGQLGHRDGGLLYVPLEQRPSTDVVVVARSAGDPRPALESVRSVVRRVAPDAVMTRASTGIGDIAGAMVVFNFIGRLAGGLGGTALLLAMTGLYGVMALVVSHRTREMGVRIALGAERADVMRMVFLDGLKPVMRGVCLGLAGGALIRPIFQAASNFPIQPVDPIAFALIPVPLVLAALLACYLPARRAASVDPNVALRDL
jgi:putative ABC transport system permease protein